jgi:hypothetical protein
VTPAQADPGLTERLVFKAARVATVVHDEGGRWDVTNLIGHLDRGELLALVVVLAGMVSPDQTVEEALGYITWDENGNQIRQELPSCTVRELANRRLRAVA